MKASSLLVAAAIALFTVCGPAAAQAETDFEWFSSLGFRDVKDLPFVRYSSGWISNGMPGGGEPIWDYGFLLEDKADSFRVLTLNFAEVELPKSRKATDENYQHEPANFYTSAESMLPRPDARDEGPGRSLGWGPHFDGRAHFFVLGWMCSRQGVNDLAAQFMTAAQAAPRGVWSLGQSAGPAEIDWPFRSKLDRDLGHFEMWRTMIAFGDPHVTRRELLARLRALPVKYPHCDHLPRTASLAAQLETMIAEDDAHPLLTDAQIAALSPAEQAKEWIFRLRDLNGRQFSQPGWVDIFRTDVDIPGRMGGISPAHRLVQLGDVAIPTLIAALADQRLTRSVGYGRNFYFSHHVLTVGDAALKIIERIAGRTFYRSGSVQGSMAQDGETDPVVAAVREWWLIRMGRGVEGEMVETTIRGESGSARAGEKLLDEFPAEALPAVLKGAAAAKDEGERSRLIRLLGKVKNDRAAEFLLREAREGSATGLRAEAAWQLAKFGRLEGIASLAELWRTSTPSSSLSEAASRRKLINALAMADSPDGLRALKVGLLQRTPAVRRQMFKALDTHRTLVLLDLGDYGPSRAPALSADAAAAMEELLVSELNDTAAWTELPATRKAKTFGNLRLCEEAARLLAARWPDRYAFDADASFPGRERQRIACANVWRAAHAQPLLPVPPPRLPVVPGDEMKIAKVVFAGEGIRWPETTLAVLRTAAGRPLDGALFREIERTFLDACADQPPATDRGFFVKAFRENAADGITLLVAPAERRGVEPVRQREWSLEYSASLGDADGKHAIHLGEWRVEGGASPGNADYPHAIRFDIFGRPDTTWSGSLDDVMRLVAAHPPTAPFQFSMELAPDRRDSDDAF